MKYLISLLFILTLQATTAQIALKIKSIEIDYDVHYITDQKQLYNGIWLNLNLELINDTFDVIQIHPPGDWLEFVYDVSFYNGKEIESIKHIYSILSNDKLADGNLISPYKSYCFTLSYELQLQDQLKIDDYIDNLKRIMPYLTVKLKLSTPKDLLITSEPFRPIRAIIEGDDIKLDNWKYLETLM